MAPKDEAPAQRSRSPRDGNAVSKARPVLLHPLDSWRWDHRKAGIGVGIRVDALRCTRYRPEAVATGDSASSVRTASGASEFGSAAERADYSPDELQAQVARNDARRAPRLPRRERHLISGGSADVATQAWHAPRMELRPRLVRGRCTAAGSFVKPMGGLTDETCHRTVLDAVEAPKRLHRSQSLAIIDAWGRAAAEQIWSIRPSRSRLARR